MNTPFPTLQTARISLRTLEHADAWELDRIYHSKDVLRYFPNPTPPPIERIQRFIIAQQAHWEMFGYGNWACWVEGGYRFAGWVGLQFVPELNETEVGFLLDRPFWGKGYATEAALAAIDFGFSRCGLDHLIALVHPENLASRAVIRKCGLSHVDNLQLWGLELMRHAINAPSKA